jgi:hypothetical protein
MLSMPTKQNAIPHSPDLNATDISQLDLVANLFQTKSPVSLLAHELDTNLFVNREYNA